MSLALAGPADARTLHLTPDEVTARDSTGFGESGFGDTVIIPGNNGDCLLAASGGAGNTVSERRRAHDGGASDRHGLRRHCLDGGPLAATLIGYPVTARGAWWGSPSGPAPGRVVGTAELEAAEPLRAPPAYCVRP